MAGSDEAEEVEAEVGGVLGDGAGWLCAGVVGVDGDAGWPCGFALLRGAMRAHVRLFFSAADFFLPG